MEIELRDAVIEHLDGYERLVEVGVGRAPEVAAALADAGKEVTATDVHEFETPPGVAFVEDDVVAAAERAHPGDAYRADAVYALNLPPELHRPTRDVARAVGADFLFTTLGFDSPTVPVETASAGRETLYVVPADRREPGPESQR